MGYKTKSRSGMGCCVKYALVNQRTMAARKRLGTVRHVTVVSADIKR
jgi:hypothetical protein